MTQKRGGDEHVRILRSDLVTRDLLAHELVVGLVIVERLDDVVAIRPDVLPIRILVVAIALRIAHQVQPMLRPTFAIARARQQFIHELFIGLRVLVVHKGVELRLRRRQAVKVEIHATHQLMPVRFGCWGKLQRRLLLRDETVDVVAHPGAFDLRRRDFFHRLEEPVIPLLLRESVFGHHDLVCGVLRPRSARLDPPLQNCDLRVRQLSFRRHLEVFIRVAHRFDQCRFFRLPGHQGRAGVAPGFQVADVIHPQAALLFRVAVALKTPLHEDRAHLLLKIRHRRTLRIAVTCQRRRRRRRGNRSDHQEPRVEAPPDHLRKAAHHSKAISMTRWHRGLKWFSDIVSTLSFLYQ